MNGDETTEIKPGTNTETLKNQDLSFLQTDVMSLLSEYGWYLLILCVGIYFLIQHLSKRRLSHDPDSTSAASQDASSVARRQEALEASRLRMQAELDAKAAEFKEKRQKLEEEKRQQKIEVWESMKEGKSYKGNSRPKPNDEAGSSSTTLKPKTERKPLRDAGYNPLSGNGGGTCSWRPGRRGPSAGG